MIKTKEVVLDNGLKIYLNKDKSKHRTTANIIVRAGGLNQKFKIGNKNEQVPAGIAHFLEHYLLEKSIYGNAMSLFKDEYIQANGVTSYCNTSFYISTVHDFEENFIKLINIVNNAQFNEEAIEDVKKPVISEINRKLDRKDFKFIDDCSNSLFEDNIGVYTNLGDVKTIENMKLDDIKKFYEAFYQPSNEIIVITGNFDNNIIDIIKDTFNNISRSYKKVVKEKINTNSKINKKIITHKGELKDSQLSINYRIDLSKLSPEEMNKLDYYYNFILSYNFGEKSQLFDYLTKNKYTNFAISSKYESLAINNISTIRLHCYTNKYDEVIKILQNQFNNLSFDEKEFNIWKNKMIIRNINLTENNNYINENLIDNILNYDYCKYDDIKFIKSFNYRECINLINSIDYSNFTIVKNELN